MNKSINSLAQLRKNYALGTLSEDTVPANPMDLFHTWFEQASQSECPEPNAMVLATADSKGSPSARVVLLKALKENHFCFFTNYLSQKGRELKQRPEACLLFHWHELERQVRITGKVSRVSEGESDLYYQDRPLASRIGAWASPQSQTIPNRAFLEEEEKRFERELGLKPKRPEHWGGYQLVAHQIEFWQGRPSRLHDRILYQQLQTGWAISRLAP
jgi:pyridoxamine 5'-phosphate oxidase